MNRMAMTRRQLLLAAPAALTRRALESSRAWVEGAPGLEVRRVWSGDRCRSTLVNRGDRPARVGDIVLVDWKHSLPPSTALYGESFQMLSQTAGTLAAPVNLAYSEPKHYKIPQPEDATVVTSLLTLSPAPGSHLLLAFGSCRRFIGRFYLRPGSIQVVLDGEGLELGPGESWELEDFLFLSGADRPAMLERLARVLDANRPPLRLGRPPAGWCSWYCFGPRVTAQQVLDNLDVIAKHIPGLKYVQIDDGYQPAMGDWLETGSAFGGNVQGVLKEIRRRGFEPAIWVGPFIAEAGSNLFRQHPDWFIKDAAGQPLCSDRVTFAGWRRKPWYALDGTHPETQRHLEHVFRPTRNESGCTYFKLDANFWGAMHGGRFHDPKATRIEAYRRGMQAILRGAGDSFILGCNHPIRPSLGLIHGSRSSGDASRRWTTLKKIARETLSRNWQNGRLWWNDPDCLLLTGNLTADEFRFHATAVYASGGMILSGDDLTKLTPEQMEVVKKFLPPTGIAAQFEDHMLSTGIIPLEGGPRICVFNWGDEPKTMSVRLPRPGKLTDVWTGETFGAQRRILVLKDMPPHSARLLRYA